MILNFINKKLAAHPKFPIFYDWVKTFTFPGLEKVPLFEVIKGFREEIKNDAINIRAAFIAYFSILALFPSIIFFFTLIPYFPIPNLDKVLMNLLMEVMPEGIFSVLQTTIEDIVKIQRGGLLSVNFLLAIIFSTNGVNSIMSAFDKINHTFKKRTFLERRLVAMQITAFVSFQLLLAITLFVLGENFITWLLSYLKILSNFTFYLFKGIKIILIAFCLFNIFAIIYYLAPAVKKKYRYFSAGATFSTIIALLFSYAFSAYINYFHNFNKLYGSIGIIIVVMLWIYLNSINLLFGFELNNSIHINKNKRKKINIPIPTPQESSQDEID